MLGNEKLYTGNAGFVCMSGNGNVLENNGRLGYLRACGMG